MEAGILGLNWRQTLALLHKGAKCEQSSHDEDLDATGRSEAFQLLGASWKINSPGQIAWPAILINHAILIEPGGSASLSTANSFCTPCFTVPMVPKTFTGAKGMAANCGALT